MEIPLGVEGIIFPSFFEWLLNEVAFLADSKVTINPEIQTDDDLYNPNLSAFSTSAFQSQMFARSHQSYLGSQTSSMRL